MFAQQNNSKPKYIFLSPPKNSIFISLSVTKRVCLCIQKKLIMMIRVALILGVVVTGTLAQHYVAPHYIEKHVVRASPYYAHPIPPIDPYSKYSFGYSVADPYTGVHNRVEEKDGPVIKGSYQVVEHDGSLRTVSYAADPIHGFNAVVDKGPLPVRDLQKFGKVF